MIRHKYYEEDTPTQESSKDFAERKRKMMLKAQKKAHNIYLDRKDKAIHRQRMEDEQNRTV